MQPCAPFRTMSLFLPTMSLFFLSVSLICPLFPNYTISVQHQISPIGFLFLKLPPPPWAVLLVNYATAVLLSYDHVIQYSGKQAAPHLALQVDIHRFHFVIGTLRRLFFFTLSCFYVISQLQFWLVLAKCSRMSSSPPESELQVLKSAWHLGMLQV